MKLGLSKILGLTLIGLSLVACNGEDKKDNVVNKESVAGNSGNNNSGLTQEEIEDRINLGNSAVVDADQLLADLDADFADLGLDLDNLPDLANLDLDNLPVGLPPIDAVDLDALLDKAKDGIADAIAAIDDAIANLDPNDPVQADVIAALNDAKAALMDVAANL